MVWWLRFPASNAGGMSLMPGQGTKIPCATWHGQKKKKKVNNQIWWWLFPASVPGLQDKSWSCSLAETLHKHMSQSSPMLDTFHPDNQEWMWVQDTELGDLEADPASAALRLWPWPSHFLAVEQIFSSKTWELEKENWELIIVPPLFRYCDD